MPNRPGTIRNAIGAIALFATCYAIGLCAYAFN